MEHIIESILAESVEVKKSFIQNHVEQLMTAAGKIAHAFTADRKLLLCGNGGSAADAQHVAAEFINRYSLERPPLPALALTTDTSVLTSIGNDYAFEQVFAKQVKGLGKPGDVLLLLTTSGNSSNILNAAVTGREQGLYSIGLLGKDGGKVAAVVDLALVVRNEHTPRLQEAHILAGHILCHLVDYILFQRPVEPVGNQ